VANTIAAADAFLATKNSLNWSSLTKAQKAQVLSWMTTLDNYNEGPMGPGHCSERSEQAKDRKKRGGFPPRFFRFYLVASTA
jgi:hypothetical protein